MAIAALARVAGGAMRASKSAEATEGMQKKAQQMMRQQEQTNKVAKDLHKMGGDGDGIHLKQNMQDLSKKLLRGGDSVQQVTKKVEEQTKLEEGDTSGSRKRKASSYEGLDERPAKRTATREVSDESRKRKAPTDDELEQPSAKKSKTDGKETSEDKKTKPEKREKGAAERAADFYNNWGNQGSSNGSDFDPGQVIMNLLTKMAPSSDLPAGGGDGGGKGGSGGPGMVDQMALSHGARMLDKGRSQKSTGKDAPSLRSVKGGKVGKSGFSAASRSRARSEQSSHVRKFATDITNNPSEVRFRKTSGARLQNFLKSVEKSGKPDVSSRLDGATEKRKVPVAVGSNGKPLPSMERTIERARITGSNVSASFTDDVSRKLAGREKPASVPPGHLDVTRGTADGRGLVRSGVSENDFTSIRNRLHNPDNYTKSSSASEKFAGKSSVASATDRPPVTREKARTIAATDRPQVSRKFEEKSPVTSTTERSLVTEGKTRTISATDGPTISEKFETKSPVTSENFEEKPSLENEAERESILGNTAKKSLLIEGAEVYTEARLSEESVEAERQRRATEQEERLRQVQREEELEALKWGADEAYDFATMKRAESEDVTDSGYDTDRNRERRESNYRRFESTDRREGEFFDEDGEPIAPGELSTLSTGEQPVYLRDGSGEEIAYVERWDKGGRKILVAVNAEEMGVMSLEQDAAEGDASAFKDKQERTSLRNAEQDRGVVATIRRALTGDSGYVSVSEDEFEESAEERRAQGRDRGRGSMDLRDTAYFNEKGESLAPEEATTLSSGEQPHYLSDRDGKTDAYVKRRIRDGQEVLVPLDPERMEAVSLERDAVEGKLPEVKKKAEQGDGNREALAAPKSGENTTKPEEDEKKDEKPEEPKGLWQRFTDSVGSLNDLYQKYQMWTGGGGGGLDDAERNMMEQLKGAISADGGDDVKSINNYNQAMERQRRLEDDDEGYDAGDDDADVDEDDDVVGPSYGGRRRVV